MFVRIGHLGGGFLDEAAFAGAAATARVLSGANMASRVTATIQPDYAAGTAVPQVINGIQASLAQYQQSLPSFPGTQFQAYAQDTLKTMYGIDVLAIPANAPLSQFQAIPLAEAVVGLINQMVVAGTSIQQATVSAGSQTAVGTPTGNAKIVVSLKNGLGYSLQLPFPETLRFICTQDQNTGATLGNETMSVTGEPLVNDPNFYLYPGGSGVNTTLTAVDGTQSNAGGNMLYNSDFTEFNGTNANYPDNWIVVLGTAGTNVFDGGTAQAFITDGGCLKITGDGGGTLVTVDQLFGATVSESNGAGGTPATLLPNSVYHINLWMKRDNALSAGVLTISLVNGSTGAVLTDALGNNCSFTCDLTTLTGSYANFNGALITPAFFPSTVHLRLKTTTAIDSGDSFFIADLSMAQADNSGNGIYPGGPFVTVHSASTALVVGDYWTIAIANSYGTSGSGLMALLMQRWFGLNTLLPIAVQLPYSGSPTVADSLIT